MRINIIFGTETGESEMVADDIKEALETEFEVSVEDMQDVAATALETDVFYLVVCSTYGQGDLPASAQPFFDDLSHTKPDLTGLHYAMLGRGDSSHRDSYSKGSEHIDRIFTELGAKRVGEYGRDDAGDVFQDDDLPIDWAHSVIATAKEQGLLS